MSTKRHVRSLSPLLFCLVLAAGCTSGGTVPPALDGPPAPDIGATDSAPADQALPDLTPPDTTPPDAAPPPDTLAPDLVPPPDLLPPPDQGLCGNKQVDTPGEECDKAIGAGKEGACPTSLADCDDLNKCTTDSLSGSAASCTAKCVHTPVTSCCGNGIVEPTEACDDGNVVDKDGCNNLCQLPGGHLLITEVATSPTEAEFIELYNPASAPVALDDMYLADRNDYFSVTSGLSGASTDFVARFPAGTTLAPGAYLTVALNGLNFKIAYGMAPDFEIKSSDGTIPDMLAPSAKAIGSSCGLTDNGELLVLFSWDGSSDLVKDVDYVVWKGSSATAVYKSSTICIDGPDSDSQTSCYLDDTAVLQQSSLSPPQQGGSLHRCNYLEGAEVQSGGNGVTGHDETSEPFDGVGATWKRNPNTLQNRTPGAPAPPDLCPK